MLPHKRLADDVAVDEARVPVRVGEAEVDRLVGGNVEEVDVGLGQDRRELRLFGVGGQRWFCGEESDARVELREGLQDEGLDVRVLVGDDGVQLLFRS